MRALRQLSPAVVVLLTGWATGAATAAPAPAVPAAPAPTAVAEPGGLPADGDPAKVVATIQDKPITLGELRRLAAERLEEQRATYRLRREQLDLEYRRSQQQVLEEELSRSLNRQVLELEAAAHKTNVLKLTGEINVPTVTDAEVRARYESRKLDGAPPFEQVAAEIRKGLQDERTASIMEAYYASLRARYGATARLEPLRQEVGTDGPALGPADAPVTVVEFADFQCPFCRRMAPTLKDVMQRYPTKVRLVYRHFPLSQIHPQALHASQAALCAQRQGKFWQMHDAIFSDNAPLGVDSLRAIAGRIGLDADGFEKCVRDPEVDRKINADVTAAEELGVQATPTLFVNGRFLQGGVPEDRIVALIEDELRRLQPPGAKTVAR